MYSYTNSHYKKKKKKHDQDSFIYTVIYKCVLLEKTLFFLNVFQAKYNLKRLEKRN
jgi:hypothetical protein